MAWYEIVNAKSDSYVTDRNAEDLLREFSAALRDAKGPVDAEVFYGLTVCRDSEQRGLTNAYPCAVT